MMQVGNPRQRRVPLPRIPNAPPTCAPAVTKSSAAGCQFHFDWPYLLLRSQSFKRSISNMEIPKAYEPKECEGRWYPVWEQHRYFTPESNADPNAPVYSIVIPPPNVTGYLHMGHAL